MKNCPWFSLRSNSIESRYRSIRRGNFLAHLVVTLIKSKSTMNSLRSQSFFCSLRSVQVQISTCDLRLFRLLSLKSCFSESLGANFCCGARRHSLINTCYCLINLIKIIFYRLLLNWKTLANSCREFQLVIIHKKYRLCTVL